MEMDGDPSLYMEPCEGDGVLRKSSTWWFPMGRRLADKSKAPEDSWKAGVQSLSPLILEWGELESSRLLYMLVWASPDGSQGRDKLMINIIFQEAELNPKTYPICV